MPVKQLNRPRCILDDVLDRSDLSPTTRIQYEWVIGQWLKFAGTDPKGWTRLRAQLFYDQLVTSGIKTKTANGYLRSLRLVSHWFALQYGGEDFAVVQQRIAPNSPRRRALSEDEVRALLLTCDGPMPLTERPYDRRDRALLVVGVETGMRRMSIAGMRIENIDERGDYPIALVPIKGRGGRATFEVPLSDTAMLALRDWIGWLRARGVSQGPVFRRIDNRGRPKPDDVGLSLAAINVLFEARAKRAGIEHVHPHLLRNTFITWRQMAGLNAPQIASITGHRTFKNELGDRSWGGMSPYLDLKALGAVARQATPPWFAEMVSGLVGGSYDGPPRQLSSPTIAITRRVAPPTPAPAPARARRLPTTMTFGEMQARALAIECPRCNAAPRKPCRGAPIHRARILAASGG
jgi:integrase